MRTSGPFIIDALRGHIASVVQQKPDYITISFISSAEDIFAVRTVLSEHNVDIPVISKIERVQAVREGRVVTLLRLVSAPGERKRKEVRALEEARFSFNLKFQVGGMEAQFTCRAGETPQPQRRTTIKN
jgi:hypothetical protein